MPRVLRISIVFALLAAAAQALAAQTIALSPSPTLPSDTLEANYGPRRAPPGPMPELAPSLPSDTLEATQPADSFPADPWTATPHQPGRPRRLFPDAAPDDPGDSAALRELKTWIRSHPDLTAPPPARAVLVRA